MKKYTVIKTIPGHPGYGAEYHTRAYPESQVVMSRHSRRELAEKAIIRYRRDHRYGDFRIESE